jgi:2-(1,2-epoxy-1,2-dihydrophenyl)acetyl-CoA isomerase
MADTILTQTTHGVMAITLNRPDKLNSMNRPMARAFREALDRAASDDAVRAVLLTGEGRAFCAGQDLAEASGQDHGGVAPPIADLVADNYNPVATRLMALEKPVVVAVNGVAAGAGAGIALLGDLVLAADTASFMQAFIHLGLIPDTGLTWTLPRLVGMARAKAMTFLGEKMSAEEARELGLIYKVVPAQELLSEATTLAKHLATRPTRGFGLTKRALHASMTNPFAAQLRLEQELQAAAGDSHDYREGLDAFLTKRPPEFTGR